MAWQNPVGSRHNYFPPKDVTMNKNIRNKLAAATVATAIATGPAALAAGSAFADPVASVLNRKFTGGIWL